MWTRNSIFGGPPGVSGLYGGHGIFGLYGSQTDFLRDLQGRLDTPAPTLVLPPLPARSRAPVVPDPNIPPDPSPSVIDAQLARGGPTFNSTTSQLNNTTTGGAGGGTGGGAGSDNQASQGYGILPWLGVGLYGLNTLGNLYLGHEALNQGWAQFRFQRDLANQNLANAIQAYNNARRDRLRGRSGAFSEEDIDRMMEEQGLKDTRKRR